MKLINLFFVLLISNACVAGTFFITDLSPRSGSTTGAYPLVITTSLMLSSPTVTVNNSPCNVQITSGNMVICGMPPGVGAVAVVVTDQAASTVVDSNNPSAHIFTYNSPSITSVSPDVLNRAGGEVLSINGLDLGSSGTVTIDGNACQTLSYADSQITCTSPAGGGTGIMLNVSQSNGTSANYGGLLSYQVCAAGTFDTGATCEACPAGMFQDKPGQNSCTICPAGSASNSSGAVSCSACPVGRFQSAAGQIYCDICPLGRFQNATGQSSCNVCGAGTFSAITGASSCTACSEGTSSSTAGASSCNLCAPGRFSSVTGASSCDACAPGTFSATSGANSCISCQLGRFQNMPGQASCLDCQSGTFSNFPGAASCTDCPVGSFQNQAGSISCLTCPDGSTQPATGQAECLGGNVCDALFGLSKSGFESGLIPVVE